MLEQYLFVFLKGSTLRKNITQTYLTYYVLSQVTFCISGHLLLRLICPPCDSIDICLYKHCTFRK